MAILGTAFPGGDGRVFMCREPPIKIVSNFGIAIKVSVSPLHPPPAPANIGTVPNPTKKQRFQKSMPARKFRLSEIAYNLSAAPSAMAQNIWVTLFAGVLLAVTISGFTKAIPITQPLSLILLLVAGVRVGLGAGAFPHYYLIRRAYWHWLILSIVSISWAAVATHPLFVIPPILALMSFATGALIRSGRHPTKH